MKLHKGAALLTLGIALVAIAAAAAGIFSDGGSGPYTLTSIRNKPVTIYGRGLYQHMSAEVAPQGIAQDYVTLFIAVPLLLFSYYKARKNSLFWHYILTGTTGYFLVTYVFYLVMGMYNSLFLAYVFLAGASFFLFVQLVIAFDVKSISKHFSAGTPVKAVGSFMIFNAVCIAFLWLSIVVPPLVDGSLLPVQLEHYTTLVVQGLDLAILLPACFVIGVWILQRRAAGYLWAPVYLVFLSLLMTALTAKVVAMALLRYPVVPVIFIIPAMNVITIVCAGALLKNINEEHAAAYKKQA